MQVSQILKMCHAYLLLYHLLRCAFLLTLAFVSFIRFIYIDNSYYLHTTVATVKVCGRSLLPSHYSCCLFVKPFPLILSVSVVSFHGNSLKYRMPLPLCW